MGCLHSLNVTLLVKWVCRLKIELTSLWSWCIKSWHGIKGIDGKAIAKDSLLGTWSSIANIKYELEGWNFSFDDVIQRIIRDESGTFFYKDRWSEDEVLKDTYP